VKPVYPQPGFTEDDAVALLASRQFVYAECYTIIPLVGDVMRFTSAPVNVNVVPLDGSTTGKVPFQARAVTIEGMKYKTSVGTEVDEQQVKFGYTKGNLMWQGTLTLPQAAQLGRLDGARVRRDRLFAPAWGQPWVFGMSMFGGRVSSLTDVGVLSATVSVKSDMVLFSVQSPRALWIAQCVHSFGDSGCGIVAETLVENVTVGAGSTASVINWSGITAGFAMGVVELEGSDSVDRTRTILSVNDGVSAKLIYPLDFVPPEGTPIKFYPNCQRLYSGCFWGADKADHFMGFPYIPVSEVAY
jgi:hypothetical protein